MDVLYLREQGNVSNVMLFKAASLNYMVVYVISLTSFKCIITFHSLYGSPCSNISANKTNELGEEDIFRQAKY